MPALLSVPKATGSHGFKAYKDWPIAIHGRFESMGIPGMRRASRLARARYVAAACAQRRGWTFENSSHRRASSAPTLFSDRKAGNLSLAMDFNTMNIFTLAFLLLAALLGGCATTPADARYLIRVERTGLVTPGRYFLVTDHPTLAKQIEYPKALKCVRTALAQRGFTEVSDPAATDLQILFSYGAAFAGQEMAAQPHTVERTEVRTDSTGAVRSSQQTKEVRVYQRAIQHFSAWFLITSRTVTADGALNGWKVVARADATREDADQIIPCLITAAHSLLAADAAATATIGLNPGDAAVRAIVTGRREAPPANRTVSP